MTKLPESATKNPTVEAIYGYYEKTSGDWRRWHLGASQIGAECDRALWYTFRWCTEPKFGGRMQRLFQTGHKGEYQILLDLHHLGMKVYNKHPDTGRQIHFEEYGGHFAGNLDAIVLGFLEAPKTWHVVECKTSNTKNFNELKAKGVKVAKPEHFAQMQMYMGWSKLDRAYYLCVCKETDEIYGERVYFEPLAFQVLRDRAKKIIFRETPPQRVSDNPSCFSCRWCEHSQMCHQHALPLVGCRTCAHSTVCPDGKWTCNRDKGNVVPVDHCMQAVGCDCHIFIPALVPIPATDADPEKGTITYGDQIVNGPGGVLSKDLQKYIGEAKE